MQSVCRDLQGVNSNSQGEEQNESSTPKSVVVPEGITCESDTDDRRWYAVKTYSCREFVVAKSFTARKIEHFLPAVTEKRRWSDRVKTIRVPLFRNYLFARVNPLQESFWDVLGTRGVTRIMGNDNGPIAVATKEIEAVVRMMESKTAVKLSDGFQEGQAVRIVSGPLQGAEGIFVRTNGKNCLAVHIELLGQSVLAEVDENNIEPC